MVIKRIQAHSYAIDTARIRFIPDQEDINRWTQVWSEIRWLWIAFTNLTVEMYSTVQRTICHWFRSCNLGRPDQCRYPRIIRLLSVLTESMYSHTAPLRPAPPRLSSCTIPTRIYNQLAAVLLLLLLIYTSDEISIIPSLIDVIYHVICSRPLSCFHTVTFRSWHGMLLLLRHNNDQRTTWMTQCKQPSVTDSIRELETRMIKTGARYF